MVLPEPGGPRHEHAVIARGRYLQRALGRFRGPATSLKSGMSSCRAQRAGARRLERPRPQAPRSERSAVWRHPLHGHVVVRRRAHERASQPRAAQRVRQQAPPPDAPRPRATARRRRAGLPTSRRSTWPVAASMPTAMGRSKPEPVLLQRPRRQVHHHLLAGHGEPARARGPPSRAPATPGRPRRACPPPENPGRPRRDHHLHVHRQRLHAPQGGALHAALAEHGAHSTPNASIWCRIMARSGATVTMDTTSNRSRHVHDVVFGQEGGGDLLVPVALGGVHRLGGQALRHSR